MVDDHPRVRERIDQIDQLRQLRVITLAIEAQAQGSQLGKTSPESPIEKQVFRRGPLKQAHFRAGIPSGHVADAAKPVGCTGNAGLHDLFRKRAQSEIHMADDPRTRAQRAVKAARESSSDAVSIFDLTDTCEAR